MQRDISGREIPESELPNWPDCSRPPTTPTRSPAPSTFLTSTIRPDGTTGDRPLPGTTNVPKTTSTENSGITKPPDLPDLPIATSPTASLCMSTRTYTTCVDYGIRATLLCRTSSSCASWSAKQTPPPKNPVPPGVKCAESTQEDDCGQYDCPTDMTRICDMFAHPDPNLGYCRCRDKRPPPKDPPPPNNPPPTNPPPPGVACSPSTQKRDCGEYDCPTGYVMICQLMSHPVANLGVCKCWEKHTPP